MGEIRVDRNDTLRYTWGVVFLEDRMISEYDFCDISSERLLRIEKGAIFKRLAGYKIGGYIGRSFLRRPITASSGRIISIAYKEVNGTKTPHMYIAEIDKDSPVLCGKIVDDFSIHMYSGALNFWGDLEDDR